MQSLSTVDIISHCQVVLESHNRLADSPVCVEKIRHRDISESKVKLKYFRGGLLHELFHVMGVQHTQERPDRDR